MFEGKSMTNFMISCLFSVAHQNLHCELENQRNRSANFIARYYTKFLN